MKGIKKYGKSGILLFVTAALLAGGCGKTDDTGNVAAQEQSEAGDVISIERDESIQIKLGYNPSDNGGIDVEESFRVYQDAELKTPVDAVGYDWEEESGMLAIKAPVYGQEQYVETESGSNTYVAENREYDWGSAKQLYLASYVDAETGEMLSGNPVVTVVKMKED